jgi:L-ribulose-5-phosphate 3-epimerase
MKVGITALVIPASWGLDETLSTIRRDGYEALELALRDGGYFTLETPAADLAAIGKKAADAGIRITSVCPAMKQGRPDLMSADPAVRRASIATVTEIMRRARAVGTDTMLLVLGSLTPELFYDDAYRNAVRSLRRLAPVAEDMGVRIAIEYVWNKFLLSPLELARFLDEVDSPNVGFYFDPGNMAIFGYPQHWVRILARHLMASHVKDFKREGLRWPPLLQGDVDFKAVMRELRRIGFDGALVSEVGTDAASFAETAAAIRTIIAM